MKSKKNDDIEEMIDLIEVEPSDKPDYQGALDRLKSELLLDSYFKNKVSLNVVVMIILD